MIKEINKSEIAECVNVIRKSFLTVADEFGFTIENATRICSRTCRILLGLTKLHPPYAL